jgi:TonB family protein
MLFVYAHRDPMPQAVKSSAPTCPFCHNQVSGELIAYGGQCPFCFGEIPGEETPTDPGEEKKAQHDKEFHKEAKKVRSRPIVPVVLALLIVVVIVFTAVKVALTPAPTMPTLNLDDETFDYSTGALAYVEPEVKPEPGKKPTNPGKPAKPDPGSFSAGKIDGGTSNVGSSIKTGPDAADPGTTIRKTGTSDPGGMQSMSSGSSSTGPSTSGLDLDVKVGRTFQAGVTLTDDNQIVDMAKRVVKESQPRMRPCVERKMKLDPDFHGKWDLKFTVNTKGQVTEARLEGAQSDPEFEQCLLGYVRGWQFQPISKELPINKPLTFGGG